MLISVANTKGGQGKTPWARELAGYLEAELLDLNPENGDAYAWAQIANHPSRLVYEADLAQILQEAAASKQYFVADCPPWDGQETRMALAFSAAVLVPVSPSPQGLRGLGRMEDLLEEARDQVNPHLKAGIVGSGKRHGVSFNAGWEKALSEAHHSKKGTHYLGIMPQRQAFLDSFANGGLTFLGSDPEAGEVRNILEKFATLFQTKKH